MDFDIFLAKMLPIK